MKIDPISAHANASGRKVPSPIASDVPTSTGATAAGRVRGRAAISHSFSALKGGRRSRTAGELAEVRTALLAVRVAALLRFLGPVEEEIRVVRQLLQAGKTILVGVEARLHEAQRERRQLEHLAAPAQRLFLELLQRDHGVDKAHLQRL